MLQELYEQYKDSFSKSDHKLIQYLLRNEEQLQYITSEELSSHTGISPATVSRFWKKNRISEFKRTEDKTTYPGYCLPQYPSHFSTEAL